MDKKYRIRISVQFYQRTPTDQQILRASEGYDLFATDKLDAANAFYQRSREMLWALVNLINGV